MLRGPRWLCLLCILHNKKETKKSKQSTNRYFGSISICVGTGLLLKFNGILGVLRSLTCDCNIIYLLCIYNFRFRVFWWISTALSCLHERWGGQSIHQIGGYDCTIQPLFTKKPKQLNWSKQRVISIVRSYNLIDIFAPSARDCCWNSSEYSVGSEA